MKFLCMECDEVMLFEERHVPGDGTLSAVFRCGSCSREMALLTNPMETRLVSSMGVKIGGREVPEQPMELVRSNLDGAKEDAFDEAHGAAGETASTADDGAMTADAPHDVASAGPVHWSPEALERLGKVPRFVRGMVKRIYTEYAQERGLSEFTPETMDKARSDLGLEGM